ncbi:universal stress protein [Defluviimonas sp. D31]|uniref:universal stress protein n=1 Tax=Defluviimonas sp. D31 TaxID=3083253 RepID=UPI00296F83DA|nr:universal stress protein [Defluviimonas sp. D31]MDW4550534.1 universal stress protein [Defluviimonas sp. D31]
MYKKILIPMALDHGIGISAIGVARHLLDKDGEIVALHVYEAPQGSVRTYLDEEAVTSAFQAARARLEQRVADHKDVTPVILAGHTGRTIADYANEIGADCIVIGSHKPGLKDYFLGSTAARVVRHAPCSVHVLR